jgi:uncharacterized membrane protein YfhO
MRGWTAAVNNTAVPIGLADNTFQTINLPAGDSRIQFNYEPPGGKLALSVALAALLTVSTRTGIACTRRAICRRAGLSTEPE